MREVQTRPCLFVQLGNECPHGTRHVGDNPVNTVANQLACPVEVVHDKGPRAKAAAMNRADRIRGKRVFMPDDDSGSGGLDLVKFFLREIATSQRAQHQ